MTRRTKILLYTWLLSSALAIPVFVALTYGWWFAVATSVRDVLGSSNDVMRFLLYGERVVAAIVVAPIAYVGWRVVTRFVPRDEDEE